METHRQWINTPFTWFEKAFWPGTKSTKRVKVVTIIEKVVEVPKDLPFERRREWAKKEVVRNITETVRLAERYQDNDNQTVLKDLFI